jgi:hypothetical protein
VTLVEGVIATAVIVGAVAGIVWAADKIWGDGSNPAAAPVQTPPSLQKIDGIDGWVNCAGSGLGIADTWGDLTVDAQRQMSSGFSSRAVASDWLARQPLLAGGAGTPGLLHDRDSKMPIKGFQCRRVDTPSRGGSMTETACAAGEREVVFMIVGGADGCGKYYFSPRTFHVVGRTVTPVSNPGKWQTKEGANNYYTDTSTPFGNFMALYGRSPHPEIQGIGTTNTLWISSYCCKKDREVIRTDGAFRAGRAGVRPTPHRDLPNYFAE